MTTATPDSLFSRMSVTDCSLAKDARTKVNAEKGKIRKSTASLGKLCLGVGSPLPQGIDGIKFDTDLTDEGLSFKFTDEATLEARLQEDQTLLWVSEKDGGTRTLKQGEIAKDVLGESHGNVSRWVKSYCYFVLFGQNAASVESCTAIMQKIGWGRETDKTEKDGLYLLKRVRAATATGQSAMHKLEGFDRSYGVKLDVCIKGLDAMLKGYDASKLAWEKNQEEKAAKTG